MPFLRENLFTADSSAVICCYCYWSFICVAVGCMCMPRGGILSNLLMKLQPLESASVSIPPQGTEISLFCP